MIARRLAGRRRLAPPALRVALFLTAAMLLPTPADAQIPLGPSRLSLEARFSPTEVAPGQEVTLEIHVQMQEHWHVYGKQETLGIPPFLELTNPPPWLERSGDLQIPDGEREEFAPGMVSHWLKGKFVLRQRFRVTAYAKPGNHDLSATLVYYACDPNVCEPEAKASFQATLKVNEPKRVRIAGITVEPAQATPGSTVTVTIDAKVRTGLDTKGKDAEWHVYGEKQPQPEDALFDSRVRVEIPEATRLLLEPLGSETVPDGTLHEDKSYWIQGSFQVKQRFRVRADATVGEHSLRIGLKYRPCTTTLCLTPESVSGGALLVVEPNAPGNGGDDDTGTSQTGSPADGAGAPITGPVTSETVGGAAGGTGLLWFLLSAVGWGLFALAMPCTYPMIPITVSFFTKQAHDRGETVRLSLTYGVGIIVIFVLIGVVVGGPIIKFAQHGVTNLIIGVLFFVFALALFGLINLQPPRFLLNLAGQASARGGYVGVFLMGGTLVVTSFTCTAPFVGTLLSFGATTEFGIDWLGPTTTIVLGMGTFGLTMAVPFVCLSLLPSKIQALPKSGEWMNTLKIFLGFVELAAALKFFSNSDLYWNLQGLPRELFAILWAVTFGLAGFYLLGWIRLRDHGTTEIGSGRMVSGTMVLWFAGYCAFMALGLKPDRVMVAILPNYNAASFDEEGHTIVVDDYDTALETARRTGRQLLVNFTGVT